MASTPPDTKMHNRKPERQNCSETVTFHKIQCTTLSKAAVCHETQPLEKFEQTQDHEANHNPPGHSVLCTVK